MKGFKDSNNKFHPISRMKRGVTKASRTKKFEKSKIQTLIFDKKKFNMSKAKKWASDHEFKSTKVDTQKNTLRIRQFDPNKIKKGGECRTFQLGGSGVKAVLCEVPDRFKRSARYKHVSKNKPIRTEFKGGKVFHVASSGVDIHHPESQWCMLCDDIKK